MKKIWIINIQRIVLETLTIHVWKCASREGFDIKKNSPDT